MSSISTKRTIIEHKQVNDIWL